MRHVFGLLLRLYPMSFRLEFSDEMIAMFEQRRREMATFSPVRRALFAVREIMGLVWEALSEHVRSLHDRPLPSKCSGLESTPPSNEISELEESIRFHLSQTIYCIANHRFEGARFHAYQEDRARARLSFLQGSATDAGMGGSL